MLDQLKLYGISFITMLLLDFLWIAVLMKKFYVDRLQDIGRISNGSFQPITWAAAAVYLVLSVGVVEFALPRIAPESSVLKAFSIGALLGAVIYGTYDFTNYSTLKSWALDLVFIDIAWGAFLLGITTGACYLFRMHRI